MRDSSEQGRGGPVSRAASGAAALSASFRPARILLTGAFLALLSACAGQSPQSDMQVSVAQEEAHYRARAKSYYAAPGSADDPWGPYISEASRRYDVPELWIRSVIQRESGGRMFHNGQLVTSAPGAMGLMQLMPPTYDEIRRENNLGDDPYDPHDNIMAGTAYVRQLYDTYGSPGFLAAYNAGPGRLEDFLSRNRTLPRETRNYVAAIGRQIAGTYPASRSQADLLVTSHESPQYQSYAAAALPSSTVSSVRSAWAQRSSDTPVEVAQAPAAEEEETAQTPAPVQTAAVETPTDVRSAWQARLGAQAPAAASEDSAAAPAGDAGQTSAVWAARMKAADTTPVNVSSGAEQETASEEPPVTAAAPAAPVVSRAAPARFALVQRKPAPAPRVATRQATQNAALAQGARNWAIQVGAFSSSSLARQATSSARARASGDLSGARTQVASIRVARGQLYRARLTGLSRAEAVDACHRIGTRSSACVIVSP